MIRVFLFIVIAIEYAFAGTAYRVFLCENTQCSYTKQEAAVVHTADSITVSYEFVGPEAGIGFFSHRDRINLSYSTDGNAVYIASNSDQYNPAYIFVQKSIIYLFDAQEYPVPLLPGSEIPPASGKYLLFTHCNATSNDYNHLVECK